MGLLLVVASALWFADNTEFVKTTGEQIEDGYKWTYVGKNKPSGSPAITFKTETNEYILYRLEK